MTNFSIEKKIDSRLIPGIMQYLVVSSMGKIKAKTKRGHKVGEETRNTVS